jgi:hypothetical protein
MPCRGEAAVGDEGGEEKVREGEGRTRGIGEEVGERGGGGKRAGAQAVEVCFVAHAAPKWSEFLRRSGRSPPRASPPPSPTLASPPPPHAPAPALVG